MYATHSAEMDDRASFEHAHIPYVEDVVLCVSVSNAVRIAAELHVTHLMIIPVASPPGFKAMGSSSCQSFRSFSISRILA